MAHTSPVPVMGALIVASGSVVLSKMDVIPNHAVRRNTHHDHGARNATAANHTATRIKRIKTDCRRPTLTRH